MGVRAQASIKGLQRFVHGVYVGLVTRRDGEALGDQLERHGDGQRWYPRPSILQARRDFRNKPVVLRGMEVRKAADGNEGSHAQQKSRYDKRLNRRSGRKTPRLWRNTPRDCSRSDAALFSRATASGLRLPLF